MTDKESATPPTGKKSLDRRTKIVFVVIALVAAAAVYWIQRRAVGFNWPTDLDKALTDARAQNRKVLVFFTARTKSGTSRDLIRTTLTKNAHNIAQSRVLKVNVSLDIGLKSKLATRYKIRSLPTFVLLSPQGKELNRREGFVGEMDFNEGLLNCGKIVRPGQ